MNTLATPGTLSGCPFHRGSTSSGSVPKTETLPATVSAPKSAVAAVPQGGFRCPFEVSGRKADTILEVMLSENQTERFVQFAEAYEKFYGNPDIPGMCFVLPQSVQQEVKTLLQARVYLYMYQAEMFGTELAHRLKGLWFPEVKNRERDSLTDIEMVRIICAYSLQEAMKSSKVSCVGEAQLVAGWIYVCWMDAVNNGQKAPHLCIIAPGSQEIVLRISPGGIEVCAERQAQFARTDNRNTFSIVKAPFYPETFGRHSERLELWVTREIDFFRLDKPQREAIRKAANAPLAAAGLVPEGDTSRAAQVGGVWIPEEDRFDDLKG